MIVKLLADENVHAVVVVQLKRQGWDVEWLSVTSPSTDDEIVLARDDLQSCVLITYDSDFGELIYHGGLPAPAAVIYSRLFRLKPDSVVRRILHVLDNPALRGHLVTLTPQGDRYRTLPGTKNA